MIFKLENVGKIKRAEVELHGITVVAGNNRTGKSTVGKMLYCIFSAFKNESVFQERANIFEDILSDLFFHKLKIRTYMTPKKIFYDISEENLEQKIEELVSYGINNKIDFPEILKKELYEEIIKLLKTKDDTLQRSIFDRYLQVEFSGNVNHINNPEKTAEVYAKMKDEEIKLEIKNNACSKTNKLTNVYSDVFYIDTSFALDDLNNFAMKKNREYEHRYKLTKKLTKTNLDTNIINEIEAKEKIAKIFSTIESMPEEIKEGDFIPENGRLLYREKKHPTALDFNSVSAGMKPFLTIKRLLESAEIKNKSVIVLDEPEVNLHPEWQLFFAEFIVLLQKEYDATILLATHSPYFLEAIETYGKKHNIEDKCRYYLARNEDDIYSVIEDVTQETNKIYDLFANPFRKLSSMAAL